MQKTKSKTKLRTHSAINLSPWDKVIAQTGNKNKILKIRGVKQTNRAKRLNKTQKLLLKHI